MATLLELTYSGPGLTDPGADHWPATPPEFCRYERTVAIGSGDAVWSFAADEVFRWGVKRRSGFRVSPDEVVSEGSSFPDFGRNGADRHPRAGAGRRRRAPP